MKERVYWLTLKPFDTLLQILDYHQFYLALDNEFLADRIKSLVGFLGANWRILGRPILTMIITNSMLGRLMLLRVFSYVNAAVWVVAFELLSPQIKYHFWYNCDHHSITIFFPFLIAASPTACSS